MTPQEDSEGPPITRLKTALTMANHALNEIADPQRQWSLARSGSPIAPLQERAKLALTEIAAFLKEEQ